MADKTKKPDGLNAKKLMFNALKATIKGVIFYLAYFILWGFLAPAAEYIPGLAEAVEIFVIIYIVLMIIGQLTVGTIYQHFFNTARALFVIGYMLLSMRSGIFSANFENLTFFVDLRTFLIIAMLLGLLGLAKSVIQAINYMTEKAEINLPITS